MAHTDEYEMKLPRARILVVGRAVDCEEVVRRMGLLASQVKVATRVQQLMGVKPEVIILIPSGRTDFYLMNEARHLARRHGAQVLSWTL